MKQSRIHIVTLGCSKNTVDSEHLAAMFAPEQYQILHNTNQAADIVIINTCGFIGDAKEESIDTILAYAQQRKTGQIKKLIVMGCLSQRYKTYLEEEIHEVDAFFGVDQLKNVAAMIQQKEFIYIPEHYKRNLSTPAHYAYLKISEGCDRKCSFCAIPLIRGKHISVPEAILIKEAQHLAAMGVKELILIAQDLTYYGIDLNGKRMLVSLIKALAKIDGIEWIRLQYTYPAGFPEELIELIATHPKVCNYLDMPLQHINSALLQSMKRGLDGAHTRQLVMKIRQQIPDLAFRTTFIVGYPGETKEMFEELCEFVKEMRFERMGVFAFSAEEDTTAYNLGDSVPEEEKQKRVEMLMAIQQDIALELNRSKIGSLQKVLIDRKEGEYYIGRTQYDSPEVDNEVIISGEQPLETGKFYDLSITGAEAFDLYAEHLG
ncbi:MAG: 30S ribosomal protein S12 methylthiotransferase RimO [Bacteroidales bacterium]|nr:30S ribosomal protein S12 methylthiotransferase RimO [Bacteroidales bacterium]